MMNEVFQKLASRRVSITPERRILVNRLESVPDHFDAEELYVQLKSEGLPVSRATLYRTLDLLVQIGYLRRFTLERGKAHYEKLVENEPLHGHMYCTDCGGVTDFPAPDLDALRQQVFEEHGFKAGPPELKITGVCKSCRR